MKCDTWCIPRTTTIVHLTHLCYLFSFHFSPALVQLEKNPESSRQKGKTSLLILLQECISLVWHLEKLRQKRSFSWCGNKFPQAPIWSKGPWRHICCTGSFRGITVLRSPWLFQLLSPNTPFATKKIVLQRYLTWWLVWCSSSNYHNPTHLKCEDI